MILSHRVSAIKSSEQVAVHLRSDAARLVATERAKRARLTSESLARQIQKLKSLVSARTARRGAAGHTVNYPRSIISTDEESRGPTAHPLPTFIYGTSRATDRKTGDRKKGGGKKKEADKKGILHTGLIRARLSSFDAASRIPLHPLLL